MQYSMPYTPIHVHAVSFEVIRRDYLSHSAAAAWREAISARVSP